MTRTQFLSDPRSSPATLVFKGAGQCQRANRPDKGRPVASPCRRRFDRVTLCFWVGGALATAAGGLFAASMPYQYPVGLAISVLWWGIYGGCTGASLSALFCWLVERTPASPPRGSDDAGMPSSGTDGPAPPGGSSNSLSGANRR
jgi:hypothetical protein